MKINHISSVIAMMLLIACNNSENAIPEVKTSQNLKLIIHAQNAQIDFYDVITNDNRMKIVGKGSNIDYTDTITSVITNDIKDAFINVSCLQKNPVNPIKIDYKAFVDERLIQEDSITSNISSTLRIVLSF